MKVVIINQARMTSTRLPKKVLKQVLGKSLLEYQIERLQRVKLADQIVMATTINDTDQPIIDLCDRLSIPYYRGSEDDVLSRYHGAAIANQADVVVRVTSDCPLIDPQVIDQVIQFYLDAYPKYDYVSNCLGRTYPRGMDTEVFSFKSLDEAFYQATAQGDREHVTPFVHRQFNRYNLGQVNYFNNHSEHRWTVDTLEDFELIKRIIESLYPFKPKFSLQDCLELLLQNPQWSMINQYIDQKQYGEYMECNDSQDVLPLNASFLSHALPKLGNVAIRVDANPTIGMGHLRRCLTLGRQLQNDGFTIRLISRYYFEANIQALIENFSISWLNETNITFDYKHDQSHELWDAEATLSIIGNHPTYVSWVIVDNYNLGELWERVVCNAGHRILAIDDFRNRRHHADVLVSDTSSPFSVDINGNENGFCELIGSRFSLVDQEFSFVEEIPLSLTTPKQILISYGGSDTTNETTKALDAIRLLKNDEYYRELIGMVDVVVGKLNIKADIIMCAAEGIKNTRIHTAPKTLAHLLRSSDIFLTAGGNSMVESLMMRKPCLVTVTSENQMLMVNQLVNQSAIISLGNHATVSAENISDALIAILTKYEQVAKSFIAQSIFDHLGASRISTVMQLISKGRNDF